jgi:DNA primase
MIIKNNTFSCLSCGAGSSNHSKVQSSDVYSFVMGALNVGFYEALQWLSEFMNMPIPIQSPETKHKIELKKEWYDKCNNANKRFHENLLNNDKALFYLYQRGFGAKEIDLWKIGFGDEVDSEFSNTKNRIVFPFIDENGQIISFTGRTMLPDYQLKELNDKRKKQNQNPIVKYQDRFPLSNNTNHPFYKFEKGKNLYGLNLAKQYISQWKTAVVVEGWIDVIMLHKCGVFNAVATMGTMLTSEQIQTLKRLGANKIITLRDGDSAGQSSAARDVKAILAEDLIPLIISLPSNHDPADFCMIYINNHQKDELVKYLSENTKTHYQWLFENLYNEKYQTIKYHYSQASQLKIDLSKDIQRILNLIKDPIEKEIYIQEVSNTFEISLDNLKLQLTGETNG